MTCIVGYQHGGKVYVGGDSAGVAGYSVVARADDKVFRNGPYVIGGCGSFRMLNLLRYAFKPPIPREGEDVDTFMATRFVDAVRTCLKDGGHASASSGEEENGGGFLVGLGDRLFIIEGDYQVGINRDPYGAAGCGYDLAMGAIFGAAPYLGHEPERLVTRALEAAAAYSGGVCAPFTILTTEPWTPEPVPGWSRRLRTKLVTKLKRMLP